MGNSIRGARYQFRKKNVDVAEAAAFLEADNFSGGDSIRETNQNTSRNSPSAAVDICINEENGENIFDNNECL